MQTVILRPWAMEDAAALAEAANNKRIWECLRNAFPFPYSLEDAKNFIGDCRVKDGNSLISRAILVDGKAVGETSVRLQEDVYEKDGELGYFLAEPYWGRGIMTEAVKQITREAFSAFALERIYAEVYDFNKGSQRVLEKAGFTLDGIMRNSIYKNGKICSSRIYSLLRGEQP